MHKLSLKTIFFFSLLLLLFSVNLSAALGEKDRATLEMFYDENDIVETPTRYPKSISQVAENVSIVTAEQIRALNAHTVADVLNHIPGVLTVVHGGPGSVAYAPIQGSDERHVLVMIDGVSQNSLTEELADIGAIPVQNIERIEIVKGPASSSWGSSLGGVINIITKAPDDSRAIGGLVSASFGSRSTGDYRTELSGGTGKIGYYLSGGGLTSDGLAPHNSFHGGNAYAKMTLAATDRADLTFTLGYYGNSRGLTEVSPLVFDNSFSSGFSTVSLSYVPTNDLSLSFSLQGSRLENGVFRREAGTGQITGETSVKETGFGGTATATWRKRISQLTTGVDFRLGEVTSPTIAEGRQNLDKWGVFVNDTFTIGRLSLTPGLRYDYTSTNGDFLSPSFGITYSLTENTVLRAYFSRGFMIPGLSSTFITGMYFTPNPGLKMETINSYSVGLETADLRYVWLKTMFFLHDVDNVMINNQLNQTLFSVVNGGKQHRQGIEVELKTMPVYHTSLVAGYAYVKTTGEDTTGPPRYTIDVGVQYDDRKTLQAKLKGRYIRWREDGVGGSFNAMVWDLHLSKKLPGLFGTVPELFFSANNLFNSSQYLLSPYRNPGRWFEGGMRFEF